uniref:Ig-like domain-containing protein n=1 Tax=Mola mola TaxID=94237 RepID=A0A3Q3W560_MOLML
MRLQVAPCLLLQLIFEVTSQRNVKLSLCQLNHCNHEPSIAIFQSYVFLFNLILSFLGTGQYVCWVKETNMDILRSFDIIVDDSTSYTFKTFEGSKIYLPCHLPPSSPVKDNAHWFKETDTGRTQLNLEESLTGDIERVELLYPLDHDQTIKFENTVLEDTGVYVCESPEGEKLSTVHLLVEVSPTPVPYSCKGFTKPWEPCHNESSRTWEPTLQESVSEFSMKLYSFLRESQPSGNLLFSPISISMLLSHLLLGARGETQKAIERAIFVPHDFHCVHLQMKKMREKLASSLQMASQIYYNPHMNLSESFTDQSIQFYEASPIRLLESSEENTQMINSWVANKTNNKIQHLVNSVSPSTQLILLNAVSFSGQWKIKFETKSKKGFFQKLNGDLVKVPILHHEQYMAVMTYVANLKAQVARFSLSGDSSLYVLLPLSNSVLDLQQVEDRMTDTAVHQMINTMKQNPPHPIEVTLPQIKLDVQSDMHILIKKLGLSSLFEDANLCGLYAEDRLVLDDARHKAFLALTEQGVEAGGASFFSFSRSHSSFSALQPFIMLLWSDQANVPLFVGRVTDP